MVGFPELIYESPVAGAYLRLYENHEGSALYDFASLATVTSIILGRRVSVYIGREEFPNLYTLLVGDTGTSRKTTAVSRASKLPALVDGGVRQATSINSAEGLIDLLADQEPSYREQEEASRAGKIILPTPAYARVLIRPDEYSSLLRNSKRQSTSNIQPRLVELFDCPDAVQNNTRHGRTHGTKPTVALLSASTTAWLQEDLIEADIGGGVYNRTLFVVGDGHMRAMNARPKPPEREAYNVVVNDLREALEPLPHSGEGTSVYKLTRQAGELWDRAYGDWHAIMGTLSDRDKSLRARLPQQWIKLALIHSVWSKGKKSITVADLACAMSFVNYCAEQTAALFGGLTSDRRGRIEKRILNAFDRRAGKESDPMRWPLAKRDLHAAVGGDVTAGDFNTAVSALVMADALKWVRGPDGTHLLARRGWGQEVGKEADHYWWEGIAE